jgi:HSP20 family protein
VLKTLALGLFGKNQPKKKEVHMTNIIKKENGRPATFGSVVDQLFQTNMDRFFDDRYWGFSGLQTGASVPVNVRETDKSYELEVVAPGLRKEDFHLQLTGDALTVSFEHKEEKSEKERDRWLRREYRLQSFARTFTLDDTVDAGKANARYENGVLWLTLPKKEQAQRISRTIDIH